MINGNKKYFKCLSIYWNVFLNLRSFKSNLSAEKSSTCETTCLISFDYIASLLWLKTWSRCHWDINILASIMTCDIMGLLTQRRKNVFWLRKRDYATFVGPAQSLADYWLDDGAGRFPRPRSFLYVSILCEVVLVSPMKISWATSSSSSPLVCLNIFPRTFSSLLKPDFGLTAKKLGH